MGVWAEPKSMSFSYVLAAIVFTVYGQIILKWQVSKAGPLPLSAMDKASFLSHLLLNPWVLSAFGSAMFAALAWMAALSKFDLELRLPFYEFVLCSSLHTQCHGLS